MIFCKLTENLWFKWNITRRERQEKGKDNFFCIMSKIELWILNLPRYAKYEGEKNK